MTGGLRRDDPTRVVGCVEASDRDAAQAIACEMFGPDLRVVTDWREENSEARRQPPAPAKGKRARRRR